MDIFRSWTKKTGPKNFVDVMRSGHMPGGKEIVSQRKSEILRLLNSREKLKDILCDHLAYAHDLSRKDVLSKFDKNYFEQVLMILKKDGITLGDGHPDWHESTADEILKGEMANIISRLSRQENS